MTTNGSSNPVKPENFLHSVLRRVDSRLAPVLSDAEGNHESRIVMGDPEDDEEEEEEKKKPEEDEDEEENDGEEEEVPWQVA
jgi:hypothetical protein